MNNEITRLPYGDTPSEQGPFLAIVVSNKDTTYSGKLQVQLVREVNGKFETFGALRIARYMSPFYGVTSAEFVGQDPDDYNNTQKSYGMWMTPPDVGNYVIVICIQGDPKKTYWIGCVPAPENNMNFMIPGYAATKFVNEEYTPENTANTSPSRIPVAEYNRYSANNPQDPTKNLKPVHPFTKVLDKQGLLNDDSRGITTSSARRETPSAVFGVSTPGPVDKTPGAKQGDVGKLESKAKSDFVSRLGGSSFVMDDGDSYFLRKTKPSEGPAEYASVEQGETDGLPDIPHNELVRLRTRTGHQILLHNSEDLIYIGNARGTTWIELSSDGKIDIFASDSISIHTKNDMNFYADRDINLEAKRNINIKANEEIHTHAVKDCILIVDENYKLRVKKDFNSTVVEGNTKLHTVAGKFDLNTKGNNTLTSGASTHIKSSSQHIEEAGQIHMNGPSASAAETPTPPQILKTHILPNEKNEELAQSIVRRIPTAEPYPHHENLDPEKYKIDKTDRDVDSRYMADGGAASSSIKDPASTWKKYSTSTDTFEKLGEPNQEGTE